MRFLSAIHLSSILSLTAVAAPLTHPARGDAAEIPREVHTQRQEYDSAALAARMGAELLEEFDLTARDHNQTSRPNSMHVWRPRTQRRDRLTVVGVSSHEVCPTSYRKASDHRGISDGYQLMATSSLRTVMPPRPPVFPPLQLAIARARRSHARIVSAPSNKSLTTSRSAE
ncbi:hypothetical protein FB451DRAFT_1373176 [Mycena latifolia]|nr:hypothetical protein FB451DRAFT_1373176 [Mycena latifolia]